MNVKRQNILAWCLNGAVMLYAWWVLGVQHGDQLYTIQDLTPWMSTSDYYAKFVGHPGGLGELAGNWLTQFFHLPWLGASILVMMWAATAMLLAKANRLEGLWITLTIIPIVALMTSIVEMGYLIFCLKADSYWFGPTIGLLTISAIQYMYSRSTSKWRLIVMALTIVAGYPLLGWCATVGVAVMLMASDWKQTKTEWLQLALAVIVPAVIVGVWYSNSPHVMKCQNLLLYGMPNVKTSEVRCAFFDIPLYVMIATTVALPLLARMQKMKKMGVVMLGVVVVALGGSSMLNYHNHNYMVELSMMRAMDEGRWDDLLREMRESSAKKKPTRAMVMMKDVALAQKGLLGECAFDYEVGGTRPQMNANFSIHTAHSVSQMIYYWIGMPTCGYVWAMENSTKYGMSPYHLRTLYRCMMANGEIEAAERYRKLLSMHIFWRDYRVSEDELANVRRYKTGRDKLASDGGMCEFFLMKQLKDEQYDTAEAQQIAVHYAVLARDRESYTRALERYKELNGDRKMPKYFNKQTFEWYYESNTGNKTY